MLEHRSMPTIPSATRLMAFGSTLLLASSLILGSTRSAQAADKLVLTYGLFGRSITVEELENFVTTGRQTPTLKFLLKATKQKPDQIQTVLSQEIPLSAKLLDDILYILPGEYALFMAGKVFHTPARRSNDKALRSTLILSTVDDQKISVLEFLRNYPTREFYVDGYRLAKTAGDLASFVNTVENNLAGPITILTDLFNGLVCDCEKPSGPESPIHAN